MSDTRENSIHAALDQLALEATQVCPITGSERLPTVPKQDDAADSK